VGRVETLGGGRPCRITGEGLSPARSGTSLSPGIWSSNGCSTPKAATWPKVAQRPQPPSSVRRFGGSSATGRRAFSWLNSSLRPLCKASLRN